MYFLLSQPSYYATTLCYGLNHNGFPLQSWSTALDTWPFAQCSLEMQRMVSPSHLRNEKSLGTPYASTALKIDNVTEICTQA